MSGSDGVAELNRITTTVLDIACQQSGPPDGPSRAGKSRPQSAAASAESLRASGAKAVQGMTFGTVIPGREHLLANPESRR